MVPFYASPSQTRWHPTSARKDFCNRCLPLLTVLTFKVTRWILPETHNRCWATLLTLLLSLFRWALLSCVFWHSHFPSICASMHRIQARLKKKKSQLLKETQIQLDLRLRQRHCRKILTVHPHPQGVTFVQAQSRLMPKSARPGQQQRGRHIAGASEAQVAGPLSCVPTLFCSVEQTIRNGSVDSGL